jgi:hypothetical protein
MTYRNKALWVVAIGVVVKIPEYGIDRDPFQLLSNLALNS